jgi:hypothetical protein
MFNNMQMQMSGWFINLNPVKDRACNDIIKKSKKVLGENERWNKKGDKPVRDKKDKTANKAKAGQSGQEGW